MLVQEQYCGTCYAGWVAYRCNFKAYCLFSFLNTVVYCIPAGWAWGAHGFLNRLGYVDIAGSGPVHLIGGSSGESEGAAFTKQNRNFVSLVL
jgi:ammonia channel protein AmtB